MKISLVALTLLMDIYVLYNRNAQPFPVGICEIIDCSSITSFPFNALFVGVVILFSVWYILERYMLVATFGLFLTGVVVHSLEESNGNPAENALLSLVFLAHFLAYAQKRMANVNTNNRIQYTAQFIAAVYTLSGISKICTSGLGWFTNDSQKFSLEVMRIYTSDYASTGNDFFLSTGQYISNIIIQYPLLNSATLCIALTLELGAVVLLVNKRIAFYYSILLICMHIGFFIAMNIFFPSIMLPLLIVFINPLYIAIKRFVPII